MRKGITAAVIAAVVGLGEVAAAQAPPTVQADKAQVQGRVIAGGAVTKRLKLTGNAPLYLYNVMLQVNGVTVRADRAVVNGRETTLDGNVRLTMPPSK
jgi:hypothetical protein